MAKDLEIKPTIVENIIDEMSAEITAALPELDKQFAGNGIKTEIVAQIKALIKNRIKQIS